MTIDPSMSWGMIYLVRFLVKSRAPPIVQNALFAQDPVQDTTRILHIVVLH